MGANHLPSRYGYSTMTAENAPATFPTEYEHELETWLRRRFAYLCIVIIAMGALFLLPELRVLGLAARRPVAEEPFRHAVITSLGGLASLTIVGYFLFFKRPRLVHRTELISAASLMILAMGLISMAERFAHDQFAPDLSPRVEVTLFFWHLTACLFLPWTPRESLRPLVPLILLWDVYLVLTRFQVDPAGTVLAIIFNPGILLPGLAICGWRLRRHQREFRLAMVGKHFVAMRREFTKARDIHESLFPAPYDDEHIRFEYSYTPMRELGGDFVHLNVGPEGVVHLSLFDVTGHGLPAALTVNRLFGELERIRAENPQIGPGEVLALANRYINLTMSRYNLYATAMCLSIDPYVGRLEWANAGHPPALLRRVDGTVEELTSTAVVLGAWTDEEFQHGQVSADLSPGDVVVIYTDGTFEARNRQGEQFGLGRLRDLMKREPAPDHWPQFISSFVRRHNAGRSEDDVLIAALTYVQPRHEPQASEVTPVGA